MARVMPFDEPPPLNLRDKEHEEAHEALASATLVDKTEELREQGHDFIEKLPCCLGVCARKFVNVVFCPSVKTELIFKISVAVILYTIVIVLFIIGFVGASDVIGESLTKSDIGGPRLLHIELTACALAVSNDTESKKTVTLVDSTLRSVLSRTSNHTYISLRDSGTALFVSCVGPPKDQGFLVAAYLQVGADVEVSTTTILLKSAGRSSLHLSPAPYGNHIEIRGDSMIAQLDSISVLSLSVVANQGLLDIRNSYINHTSVSAGMASISVSLPQQYGAHVQLHRLAYVPTAADTVLAQLAPPVAGSPLCISDVSEKPAIRDMGNGSSEFSLASASNTSLFFNVTRGCKKCKTIGQFYLTRGVSSIDRSEINTYDSTGDTGYTMESDYASWASAMHQTGRHILRMRVVGPGIDDMFARVGSRSEWIYSAYSDVYIWHPASQFWINTLGLFSPDTARAEVLFATSQCTPRISTTDLASSCSLDQSSDGCSAKYNESRALGVMHAALWDALPSDMTARNSTLSELYYIKTHENFKGSNDGGSVWTSIGASHVVTKFTTSAYDQVESTITDSIDGDPWKFMNVRDQIFWAAWWFLAVAFPIVSAFMGGRFYFVQRDKIIVAKGDLLWPRLWAAKQQREGAIVGRPPCKWGHSCYKKEPKHREKFSHPGDHDWVDISYSVGAQVQVTTDKNALQDAFAHTGKYKYLDEMDAALGGQFTVQKVLGNGMVGIQVNSKCLLFPASAMSEVVAADVPAGGRGGSYMNYGKSLKSAFGNARTVERDEMEKRAHAYLAHSTHFFTVLDAVILTRLPESSRVDGLPAALSTVCIHFLVSVGLCLPVYGVCWLQLRNIIDEQTDCAFSDMIRAECLKASNTPFAIFLMIIIFWVLFMLFYTIIVYLCRQIDEICPPKLTQDGRYRLSKHRKRLFAIRSSWPFSTIFWLLTTLLFVSTVIYFVSFVTYITLAACVFPERLTPVLLGVVAVIFVARETYSKLNAMRLALEQKLEALPASADQLEKTIRAEMIRVFDEKLDALALGVKDAMEYRRAMMEEMCTLFEETLHTLPGGVLDALGIDKSAIEEMVEMFDQNLQSVPGANGNPMLYAQSLQMAMIEEFHVEVQKLLETSMPDAEGEGGVAGDGDAGSVGGSGGAGGGAAIGAFEAAVRKRMLMVVERKLLSLPGSFGDVATWPPNLRNDLQKVLEEMQQAFVAKLQKVAVSGAVSKLNIADLMTAAFEELTKELITAYASKLVQVGDAVIFALRSLEEQLKKLTARMRVAFEKTVEQVMDHFGLTSDALSSNLKSASAIPHAVDEVLREHGFTTAQIVLVTVVTVLMFAVFLAFILLGCSLFMHPNSLLPSLISSGMVLLSTFTMIKSGNVSMSATGNTELTKSLHKHLAKTQKLASSVPGVPGTPSPTKKVSSSAQLDA